MRILADKRALAEEHWSLDQDPRGKTRPTQQPTPERWLHSGFCPDLVVAPSQAAARLSTKLTIRVRSCRSARRQRQSGISFFSAFEQIHAAETICQGRRP